MNIQYLVSPGFIRYLSVLCWKILLDDSSAFVIL